MNLTYASGTHRATAAGSNSYGYDAGRIEHSPRNMTSRTLGGVAYTLTYDHDNRLTGVSGNGTTAAFGYDGDGNRVKGTVNGTTTTYLGNYYEWMPVQNTGSSTSTMVKYYYAAGTRVAMRTGTAACTWLLADHLGSQAYVINTTGTTETGEKRYKPWGEQRYTSGTTATSFNFTGQRASTQRDGDFLCTNLASFAVGAIEVG